MNIISFMVSEDKETEVREHYIIYGYDIHVKISETTYKKLINRFEKMGFQKTVRENDTTYYFYHHIDFNYEAVD